MFTCIECENSYDYNTGDTDERTCYKCLDNQYVLDEQNEIDLKCFDTKTIKIKKKGL